MSDKLVDYANRKLKTLKLGGEISRSNINGKKLVWKGNGKTVHFGSEVSKTFQEAKLSGDYDKNKDFWDKKRRSYFSRHAAIKTKDGRQAKEIKGSPSYLSWYILW